MSNYTKEDVQLKLKQFQTFDTVSDRNKELVKDFIQYLRADGEISVTRQYKYICTFKVLLTDQNREGEPFITFDLDAATKDSMRKVVGKIESSEEYSDWTKRDYKVSIKKFYRTLWEEELDRPEQIQRILNAKFMKTGKNIENKHKLEALEPEEIMGMVDAANNTRDKLLPLFLFETGARISEARAITLGDIQLNQKYADVEITTLKSDKGPRTLTLTRCVGLLQRWMEEHPRRDDVDASLFVNISSSKGGCRGEQMTHENVAQILRRLAHSAGVEKRVNPHAFRHSAATYYGMEWSLTRMMYWFGWKQPDMAQTYCHENEDRMRKAKLAEEGIDKESNGHDPVKRLICGRCDESWPPTQKYCGHCSLALDKDAAEEARASAGVEIAI